MPAIWPGSASGACALAALVLGGCLQATQVLWPPACAAGTLPLSWGNDSLVLPLLGEVDVRENHNLNGARSARSQGLL